MPLYRCAVGAGLTTEQQRDTISKEIVRVHCDATGALPGFVHSFFEEANPSDLPPGKVAFVLGSIRGGRNDAQKREIRDGIALAVATATGRQPEEVEVVTADVPSKWVMEDGELLPYPGEEAEWAERHQHATGSSHEV